jgi:hypothetical protein
MKTRHIKLSNSLIISLFVLLSSGCHLLYLPNQVNVPMLTDRNDLSGNVSLGLSNVNLQAAYSPMKNVGLMVNYAGGKDFNSDNSNISNSYSFIEFGAGYYKPIGKNLLFDIYGGYGVGDAKTYDNVFDAPTNVNGRYSRVFIQPSITISAGDAFDANLAIRPVFIFMEQTTDNNRPTLSSSTFLEPVLTLKYGWKYVKIINQLGFSLPTQEVDYAFNPFILSVGINFQLKSSWKIKGTNQE